jgi:hypothetical protein
MHDKMTRLITLLCLILCTAALPAHAAKGKPILGDFDAELRLPNGHIDIDANIQALKAMSANTYFYLIWHSRFDWDDLPAFADAAGRAGIDVWVYIIPWSETPLAKKSHGFSEPFRTDYVRWAQEIARVSLEHSNIVGYVIDDFYTNSIQPDRFTVPYVRQMVEAGRRINPKIKFYALVYFAQPWADFIERFGTLVDGVVAAYPKSRLQVGNALAYLNDEPHGATAIIDFPRTKSSRAGDRGTVLADLRVTDPAKASVSFYWDSGDHGDNRGYHQAVVRVDGRTVWQTDTAESAGDGGDHVVDIDLERHVRRGKTVQLEIGIVEQRGVSHYPLIARFDDIRLTGFDTPTGMASERFFTRRATSAFTVDLLPASQGGGRFKIPMILMPAGEPEQHEKRYPESGTPRNIARKIEMCINLLSAGRVEGVVTYCLPKETGDSTFQAARQEFRRGAEAVRIAPQD